ncbi:PaaI family thioesterase [Jeongeupia naejangsanensis]|uniref:PaaI family thioesterase n=1 Tax=Jeongeupia naejangsanensis TaxID=613195 RepID=A0ABS2BGN9_9NEIS|nr:PaaI family thioesterase [Jeongeupia naejangsanensis]MBM3114780.1 PaaI family thioesterase [Jeongeupia naejangsanensis]
MEAYDNVDNPFITLLGIELIEWSADFAEFAMTVRPDHLSRQAMVHGGVLATLLDVASGYAGLHVPPDTPPRHAVTLSLAINYVAAARQGRLTVKARRTGGGRTIYYTQAEVLDEAGTLIATAQGAFKYRA